MDADMNAAPVALLVLVAAVVAALVWYVLAGSRPRAQRPQPRRGRRGAAPGAAAAAYPRGDADNEFMGAVAARPLPPGLWSACTRLQAYLDDDCSLPLRPDGERLFIHPRVQAGALLGGQAAEECSPGLFWQLYELSFDFVVLGRGGRVVCACDLRCSPERLSDWQREGLRLKAMACAAAGLAYCSHLYVRQGDDMGPHLLGRFIAYALRGTVAAPAAPQPADEEERAFLECLTCRERLIGGHGEDDFFFRGLQPLARERGLRVFCQMPLRELMSISDQECYESLRRLSIDYVLANAAGGIQALVELDGTSHLDADVRRRDGLKDRACAAAGLRLVRVQRQEGRDDYAGPRLHRALMQAVFDDDERLPDPRCIICGRGRDEFALQRP